MCFFQARFPGLQYFVPWRDENGEGGWWLWIMDGRRIKDHIMLCDCLCFQSVCDRCEQNWCGEKVDALMNNWSTASYSDLWPQFSVQWLHYAVRFFFPSLNRGEHPRAVLPSCTDGHTNGHTGGDRRLVMCAGNPPWKMIEFGDSTQNHMTWHFNQFGGSSMNSHKEMDGELVLRWTPHTRRSLGSIPRMMHGSGQISSRPHTTWAPKGREIPGHFSEI